jgi:ubiquinone/menaquinone biosynthesis C-methylase UbiE
VDYNLADFGSRYDLARSYRAEVLGNWLAAISAHVLAAQDILDLGCGTGRFTQALADLYGARVTGIDPSPAMLTQAAGKATSAGLHFVCATAEAIPVPDASFDFVFSSMAFHHFANRDIAARESCRVLRPGGFVVIRNATREKARYSPYARFFRGFLAIVDSHLPAQEEIIQVFVRAGLALRAHVPIWHAMAPRWEELADKASLRADSLLAALEDSAFDEGLRAMRNYAKRADSDERIGLEIDLYVFQLLC